MKKRLLTVLVGFLGLVAIGYASIPWRSPSSAYWQGYAEAQYVDVAPVLTGRLTRLFVHRGEWVKRGYPIFDQDDTDELASVTAARGSLAQAQANLANLEAPSRPDEIAQDRAALNQQMAQREKIASDLRRYERLLGHGSVTRQLVEQTQMDLAAATAAVMQANAKLALAKSPTGRANQIAAARGALEAAEGGLAQARWALAQRRVLAPRNGVVADTGAIAGDTITAGTTVVRLLPPSNIRVRFFVPEKAFATIHLGEPVHVTCDGCEPGLTANISFIAPQPEYTPPVIYSETTRSQLVYMVEAQPAADLAMRFKPGQLVDVRPLAKPSAQ